MTPTLLRSVSSNRAPFSAHCRAADADHVTKRSGLPSFLSRVSPSSTNGRERSGLRGGNVLLQQARVLLL
ncbi:hypothetical protein FQA47_019891 [Oryzias melastigma]|uniref:Uncharacterized protein n=1 Tax=Oryzias melastigma TaxID=30732 RepID=A0A834KY95_ORYME|nr:hypothetical protein FQA47_019891 [Oryzias melastigma]